MATVGVSAVFLQAGDEQTVRGGRDGDHFAQHGGDGARVQPDAGCDGGLARLPQPSVRQRIHARVHDEAAGTAMVLLQGAVERLRLHRRRHLALQ